MALAIIVLACFFLSDVYKASCFLLYAFKADIMIKKLMLPAVYLFIRTFTHIQKKAVGTEPELQPGQNFGQKV